MDKRTNTSVSWRSLQPVLRKGEIKDKIGLESSGIGSEDVFGHIKQRSPRDSRIHWSLLPQTFSLL